LSQADLPKQPKRVSLSTGEIPAAQRETSDPQPGKPRSQIQLALAVGLACLTFGVLGGMAALQARLGSNLTIVPPDSSSVTTSEGRPASPADPELSPESNPDTLLGHYPYAEAPLRELVPISRDGSVQLRQAAAEKYLAMAAAAEAEGIYLVPLSGFRSQADQEYLFFEIKAQRGQDASKRAEVSAPPGYSEHHTGYAIDIGDADVPAVNLSPDFENTRAFQWLKENAAFYNFELSFPKGNTQGVSYEPWHWRFVGNSDSLETFYKARSAQSSPNP